MSEEILHTHTGIHPREFFKKCKNARRPRQPSHNFHHYNLLNFLGAYLLLHPTHDCLQQWVDITGTHSEEEFEMAENFLGFQWCHQERSW